MEQCAINVQVADYMEDELIRDLDAFSMSEAIYLLHVKIQEEIGGILCFDHMALPDSRTKFNDNGWLIQIKCCCSCQRDNVRKRLDDLFMFEK